jgi:hypothetical protein
VAFLIATTATAALAALPAPVSPANADTGSVKTVRYGPFTVAAGSMDMPTMYDTVRLAVARPCSSCYVTSMQARLRYADGTTANFDTGVMLHHVMMTSQWRQDVTCSGTALGLAGERFFASGGTNPAYMGHIESMSTCVGTSLPRLHTGDDIVLHSYYNSPEPKSDVMGIMLIYLDTSG